VNRDDHQVLRLAIAEHAMRETGDFARGQLERESHSGPLCIRGPAPWNSARARAKPVNEDPRARVAPQHGRRLCLLPIAPGAGGLDPGAVKRRQRLDQSGFTPVQSVVVGERAAVDAKRRQADDVPRVHAIVDAIGLGSIARGHARLEVDDAKLRPAPPELGQSLAPDVLEADGCRDRAVCPLGELNVIPRVVDVGFVEPRVARVG